jgi:predicted transcriptional regulator
VNFSIHLEDEIFRRVETAAKQSGKTRNALIRQALREWLGGHQPAAWPAKVMAFKGLRAATRFESTRPELKEPREPF